MVRIHFEERRLARRRVWVFGAGTALSLGTTVGLSVILVRMFTQTGFYDYLSLLLTGDSAVFTYWRELSLSLIDSLPVLGLIAFFAAAGFLIWSGANAFTNTCRLIQA